MISSALSKKFVRDGWILTDLSSASVKVVSRVHKLFLKRLADHWNVRLSRLEDYHTIVLDDDLHTNIQSDLTQLYQNAGYGRQLIESSLPYFVDLLGPDLHIQKYPYIRISRPGMRQDNIGIHRDTHYGCSPFELSVSIPFTDVPARGAMGVLSGTHTVAECDLPVTQVKSAVEKGSEKHKLGFLYAPKVMSDEVRASVKPVRIGLGQALVFSLSLVHGQEVNRSNSTRITTDVRLVNSYAPIAWSRNVHADYYERLCSSPVSEQARTYQASNDDHTVSNGK